MDEKRCSHCQTLRHGLWFLWCMSCSTHCSPLTVGYNMHTLSIQVASSQTNWNMPSSLNVQTAASHPRIPGGQIANVLFPAGFTCGGTKPAIEKLCELATKAMGLGSRMLIDGGGVSKTWRECSHFFTFLHIWFVRHKQVILERMLGRSDFRSVLKRKNSVRRGLFKPGQLRCKPKLGTGWPSPSQVKLKSGPRSFKQS